MGYGDYIFWTAIVRDLYNEINNTPIELKSKKLNQYKNFNNYGVFKCKYTNKNSKFKIYLKNSKSNSLPNQARIIFNKNPYITNDKTYPNLIFLSITSSGYWEKKDGNIRMIDDKHVVETYANNINIENFRKEGEIFFTKSEIKKVKKY